jgi:hypothetical protein
MARTETLVGSDCSSVETDCLGKSGPVWCVGKTVVKYIVHGSA